MRTVRQPAVAGTFYPADQAVLARQVSQFLAAAEPAPGPTPRALIAPHAGYIYSGPVAASAYARLSSARDRFRRVLLIGPSHRVAFAGLAISSMDSFSTPLGDVTVDPAARRQLLALPFIHELDEAHADEHGLEVHLPFLQRLLAPFTLVPLVAGEATPDQVEQVIEHLAGNETLVVVSSDLSHYHDYRTARGMDAATTRAIEAVQPEAIGPDQACGRIPVQGLLQWARRNKWKPEAVDVRNSGDTAGPRDRVVGYGAYVFS